jgi:hypothetical protein
LTIVSFAADGLTPLSSGAARRFFVHLAEWVAILDAGCLVW